MGWVWLDHPDLPGGPERFPDDESVLAVAYSRGFVEVDDPEAAQPPPDVEPDEVDIHGQGWVYVRHSETGGDARIPVGAFAAHKDEGWESVTEADRAALEEQPKADLQAEAKKRGLPKSGTKQELVDRLQEDDEAPVEPTPEEK